MYKLTNQTVSLVLSFDNQKCHLLHRHHYHYCLDRKRNALRLYCKCGSRRHVCFRLNTFYYYYNAYTYLHQLSSGYQQRPMRENLLKSPAPPTILLCFGQSQLLFSMKVFVLLNIVFLEDILHYSKAPLDFIATLSTGCYNPSVMVIYWQSDQTFLL